MKGHHTAWVKKPVWARSVPVRYAVSGNSLVTFGDDELAGLVAGDRVIATVHDIAGGWTNSPTAVRFVSQVRIRMSSWSAS